jgi:oligopeptidase A
MRSTTLPNNFELPVFSQVKPEMIEPAIDALLEENRDTLKRLLQENDHYTWDKLIIPIEEMDDRLNKFWSPVRHLHAVADNDKLREAYNACLEKITAYSTDILLNHDLYLAYRQIKESNNFTKLNPPQQKVIENALRDFTLSGVGLGQNDKTKYKSIVQQLSSLQTKFEENVLDASHAWTKHITDKSVLRGIPDTTLALASKNARDRKFDGWVLTLDFPCYYPVMQYAEDRALREVMYHAYVTRASDKSPSGDKWDNSELIGKILQLRKEKASLLSFESYAQYSLEKKMAESPDEVLFFLENLLEHSIAAAKSEFSEIKDYASEYYKINDLAPWDIAFFSEKLRHHKFNFSQEDLKPYFPVSTVLAGLFDLVNRLYGITISRGEGIDVWHPDIEFYEIRDRQGEPRGGFYLDLYARRGKRGGAWMDECVIRKNLDGNLQRPVAYLCCNFTPPVDDKASLLTHDEVTTLFHEFGHGLHHMLTRVDFPPISGINGVAWDAVELPSQFMENWCWERISLGLFAKHYQTGEVLPEALYKKIIEAKNFQSAMQMVRQLEFALFDFHLHYDQENYSTAAVQATLDKIRKKTAVIQAPEYNRFQHSFTHIFAGGYAAGYYSYKWAELLSADAFSKFEENGIFDHRTGEQFLHTILEQGGSREPMDLFIEFRGRKPTIDALLRHSGIE